MVNFRTIFVWHEKYIQLTFPKQVVVNESLVLGKMYSNENVYLNTRVMKHLYDKRTAVVYFLLLKNMNQIVFKPDLVYQNNSQKKGSLIFTKLIKKELLAVIMESQEGKVFIVTAFETDEKYLEKFKLIWKRRAASPHRNPPDLFRA